MISNVKEIFFYSRYSYTAMMIIIKISLIIISFLTIFLQVSSINGLNNAQIFSPSEKPYGLSYANYSEIYWKWITSFPEKVNPEKDKTGEFCTNGQSNSLPVFFLSGSGNYVDKRVCEISKDKAIVIPIMVGEMSMAEGRKDGQNLTIEDLKRITKNDQDSVLTMHLVIDGIVYEKEQLDKYRVNTNAFDVIFPEDALFGVPPGPSKAIADGHFVIVKPLSPGKHKIWWTSSLGCLKGEGECMEEFFFQDVTYDILVK